MSGRIDDLASAGRLERVAPDLTRAKAMVAEAERHLEAATKIKALDPNGAYHLLYDAARKSISAHMLANGYRVTSAPGAHAATVVYATQTFADQPSIAHLDRMRRSRNRSEYGTAHFSVRVVESDLAHAKAIVAAVKATIGTS